MKKINKYQYHPIILLTFLFVLTTSCTPNKSNNNNPIKLQTNKSVESKVNEIDTTKQLRYTSMIYSMFEDSQGNFWFGSDEEGVCKYDGKSFTYFNTKDGLSDNQIRMIVEDEHGDIWFGTGYGISRYDGEEITDQTNLVNALPKINLGNEWSKTSKDIWIGNGDQEGGVYKFDGQNLTFLKFPVLDPDHQSFSIPGPVTGISQSKSNKVWIASYGGVIGHDGKSFIYINERGVGYHVRSILEDSKGNLWIGNNGIGILCYDGDTTFNFSQREGVNDPKSFRGGIRSPHGTLNHVFSMEEDNLGNIWFGDRDSGAWRYDGKTLTNFTIEDGLTSMFVRVIYKDNKGDLWFGMEGGVCKFNGKTFDKIY